MDNNKTEFVPTSGIANASEPALPAEPKKEFVEPEVSEPVDILAATKFFLQITGGGDV
ncbi:MAG TPA: hypothetical protein VGN86_05910 [Pyrinomonadaceae bacterium]|jgi:hypothetical protein|nr:hypothetical protein [Pyrinomonadaceae bacterium]